MTLVIDTGALLAALVLLAEDGDEIITSDRDDLTVLTEHVNLDVELFPD